MAADRYLLPQHPTLSGPHTKEELYILVERGSISRGEIVTDRQTGRAHKIGELIGGMKPPRQPDQPLRAERPAYQEFAGDTPWEQAGDNVPPEAEEELLEEEGEDDYLIDDTTGVSGDTLCYHGHPSWLSFTKYLLLVAVFAWGAVLVMPLGTKYFAAGIALASLTLFCVIMHRQHQDFYISGERVESEWGILTRSSAEVRIVDIRGIDVHQRGLLGLLGIGTVAFSSAGTDIEEVIFKNIRKPHRVKELVRQLQRRAGVEEL